MAFKKIMVSFVTDVIYCAFIKLVKLTYQTVSSFRPVDLIEEAFLTLNPDNVNQFGVHI